MPKLVAMGRKIGVKIRMAGVMSMNMPMTSRIIFISRKMIYLLSVRLIKPLEIAAGMPEYAMTKDIAEEAEIRNRMMPEVLAELSRIFRKPLKSMLL